MKKQASYGAAYISRLYKTGADIKEKPKTKPLDRVAIDKARLNPDLMRIMRMRSSVAVPLQGGEKLAVRRLARRSLPLMRQHNSNLTEDALYTRLVNLVESRRPEMRKRLIAEISAQYGS